MRASQAQIAGQTAGALLGIEAEKACRIGADGNEDRAACVVHERAS
jgi:hypothetical protein